MKMVESVIQLKCDCNNYPWGKTGKESLAARYCSQTPNTDFTIKDDTQYAEMWMGTYPTTPSYVLLSDELLQDVLNANKDLLIGKTVLSKFGADLPFLPKILSIAKALPLQMHPDKDLASKLHSKDPDKFSDGNHKPEIAVVLSPKFEVFVGFKPLTDIKDLLQIEPLRQFVSSPTALTNFTNDDLKQVCGAILSASPDTVKSVQSELSKMSLKSIGNQHEYILELLPRLQDQYSDMDPGNLVALLLMNFLVLSTGDAIYVPANGIHAYLSGDIVECMARSDNVLNTGFCPQADRDSVDLFTEALTLKQHDPQEPILERIKSEKSKSGKTTEFKPPMSEFNMLITELDRGEKETVAEVMGPSIMIITSGTGKMSVSGKEYELKEGWIFFIGCAVEAEFEAGHDGVVAYRAYAE